jgi:hypothetical protein
LSGPRTPSTRRRRASPDHALPPTVAAGPSTVPPQPRGEPRGSTPHPACICRLPGRQSRETMRVSSKRRCPADVDAPLAGGTGARGSDPAKPQGGRHRRSRQRGHGHGRFNQAPATIPRQQYYNMSTP